MAENEKAQAGSLPRIGELIDRETGIKYESYSQDQKLGRSADKPYNGMEAAAAALINNPGITDKVYDLLKQQAELRSDAVSHDMKEILKGKTLGGLPSVPMVNGQVKMGALFMSDRPSKEDVIAQNQDTAKLDKLEGVLKDPKWLVAEGASNISNFARDMETMINGKLLTDEQKKALKDGIKAETVLEHDLMAGKDVSEKNKVKLEAKLEHAMDVASGVAGIKPGDVAYEHYRQKMHEGIDAGLEAIKTLRAAGVEPAKSEAGLATHGAAAAKENAGKGIA